MEAVYKVIKSISIDLQEEQLDYLMKKIKLVPRKLIDTRLIKLIRKLLLSQARNFVQVITYHSVHLTLQSEELAGLEILWGVILQDKTPEEISKLAIQSFIDALSRSEMQKFR